VKLTTRPLRPSRDPLSPPQGGSRSPEGRRVVQLHPDVQREGPACCWVQCEGVHFQHAAVQVIKDCKALPQEGLHGWLHLQGQIGQKRSQRTTVHKRTSWDVDLQKAEVQGMFSQQTTLVWVAPLLGQSSEGQG